MLTQKELIYKTHWDYLIVLDACRFDFFKKMHGDFFRGDLKKVKSAGSSTPSWLRRTFGNNNLDDVVYISSNPYINSMGINLVDFDGRKHFYRIVDVWKTGRSKEEWIKPENTLEKTFEVDEKFPNKRKIIHYIQPHVPFLKTLEEEKRAPSRILLDLIYRILKNLSLMSECGMSKRKGTSKEKSNFKDISFKKKINRFLNMHLTDKQLFEIKKLFGFSPSSVPEIWYKEGKQGLIKNYKYNIRRAMSCVAESLKSLQGKIIVTADHGEFLAERWESLTEKQRKEFLSVKRSEKPWANVKYFFTEGEFRIHGHPPNVDHSLLRDIPWLEIKES